MKETEDPIITPFVRRHIDNGFEVKITKIGSDFLKFCEDCQKRYKYTFIKDNIQYEKCPFCTNGR